jgi:hypothetical protein
MAPTSLKHSYKIRALANDLGVKPSSDPIREIVRFCERRVRRFLRDFPECATLTQLLEICASKLGTKFEEIHSDDQLQEVRGRYLRQGEKAFAGLPDELSSHVFGITFKRLSRKAWELPYVSVIDCRGEKKFRSYYTKWHELGHLLVLTDQMRLAFCRTHFGLDDRDPEEALVDIVAGAFGFLPDMVRPLATREPSFEQIEDIRAQLCPEASRQSSLIGIVKAWPSPCIFLQAKMALKRGERRALAQGTLGFHEGPKEALRAVQITPNEAARDENFAIFPNMRIPERSIIYRAFAGEAIDDGAVEDLSWWESSDGSRLPSTKVFVQVQNTREGVFALVAPR